MRASGLHPTVVYDIFAGKSLPGRDNAIMLAFAPRMRATRRCCTMRAWCPCICARSSSALAPSSRARATRRSSSSVRRWMQFDGESGSHQMPTRFQPLATARGGAVLTAGAVAVLRVLLSKPGISLPRVRRTVQMRRPQGARRFARRRPPGVRRVATTPPADQSLPLLAPPTRRGARERRRVLSPVSRGWSVFWASCSACSSLRSFLLWDGATAGGEAKTIRPLPTRICTRSSTLNRVSLIRKQSRTTLA